MDRMEKIESKIQEKVTGQTHESFQQWLSHPFTKALLLQLELDGEELRNSWSLGQFSAEEQVRAQGQAFYILGLTSEIHSLWGDDDA